MPRNRGAGRGLLGRLFGASRIGLVLVAVLGCCAPTMAADDPVGRLVQALRIRDHLLASQRECEQAALERGRRRAAATVQSVLGRQQPGPEIRARLDGLYRTYAREACYLGLDQDIMQRYERLYAAALSTRDVDTAVEFLTSPVGSRLMQTGVDANQSLLPMLRRRQETQAIRANTLLQARLTSVLMESAGDGGPVPPAGNEAR